MINFSTFESDLKEFLKERSFDLIGPPRRFFECPNLTSNDPSEWGDFVEDGVTLNDIVIGHKAKKAYKEIWGKESNTFVYKTFSMGFPIFTSNLKLIARASDRFIDRILSDLPVVKKFGEDGKKLIVWRALPVISIKHWDFFQDEVLDKDGNVMIPEDVTDKIIDEAYDSMSSSIKDEGETTEILSSNYFHNPYIQVRFRLYGYHKD